MRLATLSSLRATLGEPVRVDDKGHAVFAPELFDGIDMSVVELSQCVTTVS